MEVILIVAGLVIAKILYSIAKDIKAARYQLSCQGIYGKYQDKRQNKRKCNMCEDRFMCWSN